MTPTPSTPVTSDAAWQQAVVAAAEALQRQYPGARLRQAQDLGPRPGRARQPGWRGDRPEWYAGLPRAPTRGLYVSRESPPDLAVYHMCWPWRCIGRP